MSSGDLQVINSRVREVTIEAVITRADGRVERLGTIAYYHKNPLRRLAWRLGQLLKGK